VEEAGVERGRKAQAYPRIAPGQIGAGGRKHAIDVNPGVAARDAEVASPEQDLAARLPDAGLKKLEAGTIDEGEGEIDGEGSEGEAYDGGEKD
jgi:hypothetical protein